jgi:hypothetical protein
MPNLLALRLATPAIPFIPCKPAAGGVFPVKVANTDAIVEQSGLVTDLSLKPNKIPRFTFCRLCPRRQDAQVAGASFPPAVTDAIAGILEVDDDAIVDILEVNDDLDVGASQLGRDCSPPWLAARHVDRSDYASGDRVAKLSRRGAGFAPERGVSP